MTTFDESDQLDRALGRAPAIIKRHIRKLEMRVAELEKRQEDSDVSGSHQRISFGAHEEVGLPENGRVVFYLDAPDDYRPDDRRISVTSSRGAQTGAGVWDELIVRCNSTLVVLPHAGNTIRLRIDRP